MKHIFSKVLIVVTIFSSSYGKKDKAETINGKEPEEWKFKDLKDEKYQAILKAAKEETTEVEQDEVDQTYIEMAKDKESVRAGTSNLDLRWPYKMSIQIDQEYDAEQTETIEASIQTLNNAMECFTFYIIPQGKNVKETEDHLFIKKDGKGCFSKLGRKGGKQITVVSQSCFKKLYGTTIHEIMHVLGFYHEHVRPDRDNSVTIDDSSIQQDANKKLQYEIRPEQKAFEAEYDFESIMHYNLNDILKPKNPIQGNFKVGQRDHLSPGDLRRLNAMYPCKTEGGMRVPKEQFPVKG